MLRAEDQVLAADGVTGEISLPVDSGSTKDDLGQPIFGSDAWREVEEQRTLQMIEESRRRNEQLQLVVQRARQQADEALDWARQFLPPSLLSEWTSASDD